jgi:hypothetical protein
MPSPTDRTTYLKLRLREQEKLEVEAKASKEELSVSDFIRKSVGLQVNRRPPSRPRALLRHFERQKAKMDVEPGAAALKRLSRKIRS